MAVTAFNVDTVRAQLFLIASEFETTDESKLAKINNYIINASRKINRTMLEEQADEANALLAAHNISISPMYSTLTNVTDVSNSRIKRKKVANVLEVEYLDNTSNNTKINKSIYAGSVYGLQFQAILDAMVTTPFVLGGF